MKHEHPPESGVEPAVDAGAEDTGRPKSQAPVKAGRAVMLFSIVAVGVAATGIFDRRHDEERLVRWTNEQADPDRRACIGAARRRCERSRAAGRRRSVL